MIVAAAIVCAYFLGSIPTGLWLGLRLRGIDIREHGSKNIGATNTLRVLGKALGAAALTADILKGAAPVLLSAKFGSWEHLPLACGIAAILGHVTSPFVKFRGGKGVATSAGVFLALCPLAMLVAAVAFGLTLGLTRMVSAGSIVAALALASAIFVFEASLPLRAIVVLAALLVVLRHRSNIQRIFKGEENRL